MKSSNGINATARGEGEEAEADTDLIFSFVFDKSIVYNIEFTLDGGKLLIH